MRRAGLFQTRRQKSTTKSGRQPTMANQQTVGMVGIGQLGLPIATNLIKAGFRVVGYRRNDREEFVRRGGEALSSPAEVTRLADVVLLCLPSEEAQLDVLNGPEGLLSVLKAGQTVIELGTYSRNFKIAQAARIEGTGATVLEAEVSGSPPMVAERRAALYLGGTETLIDQCKPVLEAITTHHFHLGEFGCAVAMKLIANCLVTVHTLAAAEAINMAARAGFDPQQAVNVLKQGAGASAMLAIRGPMMASGRFMPAMGAFDTLEKYLKLGAGLAANLKCATPLFSTANPYFTRAIEGGMRSLDIAAVIDLVNADSVALTKLNAA
ncbi:NAD(P)-dependent oxidoreductase [uncultured Paraburkholderia sp.]|uniref:NAD(P)-dependent oxidoreductase n=1 Tax=uncultured Paraburkholderia sp. TaxID=1822466 RepID=UPI002591760E|nr:NAD(P)-dependent oxidoreductase [uncultured Paraburkholderia sp.]